jgi:hypothetical protein
LICGNTIVGGDYKKTSTTYRSLRVLNLNRATIWTLSRVSERENNKNKKIKNEWRGVINILTSIVPTQRSRSHDCGVRKEETNNNNKRTYKSFINQMK